MNVVLFVVMFVTLFSGLRLLVFGVGVAGCCLVLLCSAC